MPANPAPAYSRSKKTTDQTIQDMKTLLEKHGARNFGYKERDEDFAVEFERDALVFRIIVERHKDAVENRRKWRVMYGVMQAQLLAVAENVYTFSDIFMPEVVTETGQTVRQRMKLELDKMQQKALPPAPPAKGNP